MRLQIAITAICSLEICQLALNVSVKDKIVHRKYRAYLQKRKRFSVIGSLTLTFSKYFNRKPSAGFFLSNLFSTFVMY